MASYRLNVVKKHLQENSVGFLKCSSVDRDNYIGNGYTNFRYTLNNRTLTNEQRNFYEKNGYIVISDLVGDEILDQCSERFIDLCEGKVPRGNITLMKDISLMKKGVKGQYLINKVQDILYDEVFEKYFFCDKLLDVVECFTGPNIKGMQSMLINKPPDSGELTSRHPLHQDMHYFPFRPEDKIVAAWTAMENVTLDNGCLIVIPGSHKGTLLPHDYPEWEGSVNKAYHGIKDYDQTKIIPLPMKKGDTVFFHPLLIHGSGPNTTKGFRKAISCHYAATDCYYIDVKGTTQENIANEVFEIIKLRGLELDNWSFADTWRFRGRLVRGLEKNL